jgi:hypothetical protein
MSWESCNVRTHWIFISEHDRYASIICFHEEILGCYMECETEKQINQNRGVETRYQAVNSLVIYSRKLFKQDGKMHLKLLVMKKGLIRR